MATHREKYNQLAIKLREISHLSGISGLLDWDQNVMMPPGSGTARANHMSALSGVLHEKKTSPELGKLIKELSSVAPAELAKELNQWEVANIRDAKRSYDRVICIPKELAQREAFLQSEGQQIWAEARKNDDWPKFVPILKELVALCREKSKCIDASLPAYDVAIEEYERGMTTARLTEVFAEVRQRLVPLIARICARPQPDRSWLKHKFDEDAQKRFSFQLARDLGFDTTCGRLDVSVHPMTGGAHPTDVRMTTRYKEDDLLEGVTGTIHETGHALYEQGRNKEYTDLPVSEALSMGIHESQSLLWERMVGLSLPFWEFCWPKMQQAFPQLPKDKTAADFYRVLNICEPSFIRVEADEVTYSLHIVLRFELERELIEGRLSPDDLPREWNLRMRTFFGIDPPSPSKGVLQDVHWSMGAFGYFPSYSLGAMFACQFYNQAKKEIPALEDHLRKGDFAVLRQWLNAKIHAKGSLLPSGDALCRDVTGEPLNPKYFLDYLTAKYTALYGL